ncbi:MAG: Flp pilus assembly protein TadD [Kiritimatiellia bacterium]
MKALNSALALIVWSCVLGSGATALFGQEPEEAAAATPSEEQAKTETEKLWDDLRISKPSAAQKNNKTEGPGAFSAPSMSIKPPDALVAAPFKASDSLAFRQQMSLGDLNLSSNLYYKASLHYWEAARVQPDSEDAVSSLAVCFLMAGDSDRAIVFFRSLTQRNPEVEDYRFNLASALYKTGAHTESIKILENLAAEHPNEAKLLYNLGINHLANDNLEGANFYLKKSYENLPQNPFPLLALARLHSQRGQKLEMLSELEKAALLLSADELRFYLDHPAFKAWNEPGLYDRVISKSL